MADRERERDREMDRERERLPPPGTVATRPTPTPQPKSPPPPMFLAELDPDSVPRELKKEGQDWFAIWNPRVKKELDIELQHTFPHDSVVCCVSFSANGRFLATGCNRTAQIFDVRSGEKIA